MIEYFIDGSAKGNMVGAGIVRVNEYGFIDKYDFNSEHISPSSTIAEGYSFEKALELIQGNDIHKNQLINIYTDCQALYHAFIFNQGIPFNRSNFFTKQDSNSYFEHLRSLYVKLISISSPSSVYHCHKTSQARPIIKLYFKDAAGDNKRYLAAAHSLSRKYIEDNVVIQEVRLEAVRKDNKWLILENNKGVLAEDKRPLIALSSALQTIDQKSNNILICERLDSLLKSTKKNQLTRPMKSAVKVIEKKLLINM